jgi:hypothetical protein
MMSEITKDTEVKKEVVVVGMSDSLRLMAVSIFLFMCMCALFTALAINPATEPSNIVVASAGLGLIFLISIFMIMRYFTEQSIVYNAMNMHMKTESECTCDEKKE